jgi:hypothetical protein
VFAFSDIRDHDHAAVDIASAVDQWRGGETDVDQRAVFSPPCGFEAGKCPRLARYLERAVEVVPFVVRNDLDSPADYFLFGPAKDTLSRGVPALDIAIEINRDDRER